MVKQRSDHMIFIIIAHKRKKVKLIIVSKKKRQCIPKHTIMMQKNRLTKRFFYDKMENTETTFLYLSVYCL